VDGLNVLREALQVAARTVSILPATAPFAIMQQDPQIAMSDNCKVNIDPAFAERQMLGPVGAIQAQSPTIVASIEETFSPIGRQEIDLQLLRGRPIVFDEFSKVDVLLHLISFGAARSVAR
jgi:hypothetical protein